MKDFYFLRIGTDTLGEALAYHSKREAVAAFGRVARELDQYGQTIDATVHMAPRPSAVVEYPDFILTLGPRGGVRVEAA